MCVMGCFSSQHHQHVVVIQGDFANLIGEKSYLSVV